MISVKNMGRLYWNTKEEADGLKKIAVWDLRKWGYLRRGNSGTITWTHSLTGRESSVGIQTSLWDDARHLRIYYTQTDTHTGEQEVFDYRIPLVTSSCNLGGNRYWFVCPWYKNGVYCGRRIGVLYKNGDRFACRHCYELTYASRNRDRRSALFGLGRVFDIQQKIYDLRKNIKTSFYAGRPTRKFQRLLKLERELRWIDMRKIEERVDQMMSK